MSPITVWQRFKAAGYFSVGYTVAALGVFAVWVGAMIITYLVQDWYSGADLSTEILSFFDPRSLMKPIVDGLLFFVPVFLPSSFVGSFLGLRRSPYWPQWFVIASLITGIVGLLMTFLVFVFRNSVSDHHPSELLVRLVMAGIALCVSFFGAWLFSFLARTGRIVKKEGAVT